MKSNAPWSVKGIERDARETAKEAARREGMTVGEWLNQMIYTAGDPETSGGEVEGLKLRDIVTAIDHLNKRIADADARNAETVGELTRNLGGMVERVQRLERVKPAEGGDAVLAERVARLESRTGDRDRITALRALEKAVGQVALQFDTAHKSTLDRLSSNERQLQEFAERLDQRGDAADDPKGVAEMRIAIDTLARRIDKVEGLAENAAALKLAASESTDPAFIEQTGAKLRVLGDEIKRGSDQIRTLEKLIARLAEQIEAAERRSAEGVGKVAETIADLREQMAQETEAVASRDDIHAAVAAANEATENRIAELQNAFDNMIVRLETLARDASGPRGAAAAPLGLVSAPATVAVAPGAKAVSGDHGDLDDIDEDEYGFAEEAPGDDGAAGAIAEDESDADVFEESEDDPLADLQQLLDDGDDFDAVETEDLSAAKYQPAGANPADSRQSDAAAVDADDDFSFELDDEDTPTGATAGRSILSEVQAALGDAAPKAADPEDDLDDILSDLDDLAANTPPPVVEKAKKPLFGDGELPDPEDDEASRAASTADAVADMRRRAREEALRSAAAKTGEKTVKRTLTPKQKAILAARARQKQKAMAQQTAGGDAPDPAAAAAAALKADRAGSTKKAAVEPTTDDDAGAPTHSPLAKAASMFAGLRAKLPGSKKNETDGPLNENAAADGPLGDATYKREQSAAASIRKASAARPVTLALGAAIVLAIAALAFLVKDLFAPKNDELTVAARPAATAAPTPVAEAGLPEDDLPVVPAPSAVNPRSLYIDAIAALNAASDDGETAAAIDKLQEAAALGHPPAQLQLGELFKNGQGVDQDLAQARTWFRRAANGGNVLAMHRIGVMTARGDGGAADSGEAVGWFERAANFGLVDSMFNLGAIYQPTDQGASTLQDAGKSYFWYSLASANGDDQATPLAAGVAGALGAAQKAALDKSIAAWVAQTPDSAANELAPAS